jgi:hypothetical protein
MSWCDFALGEDSVNRFLPILHPSQRRGCIYPHDEKETQALYDDVDKKLVVGQKMDTGMIGICLHLILGVVSIASVSGFDFATWATLL